MLLANPGGEKAPRPAAGFAEGRTAGEGGNISAVTSYGGGGRAFCMVTRGSVFVSKKEELHYLQKLTSRLFSRRVCILWLIGVVCLLLAAVLGRLYC